MSQKRKASESPTSATKQKLVPSTSRCHTPHRRETNQKRKWTRYLVRQIRSRMKGVSMVRVKLHANLPLVVFGVAMGCGGSNQNGSWSFQSTTLIMRDRRVRWRRYTRTDIQLARPGPTEHESRRVGGRSNLW